MIRFLVAALAALFLCACAPSPAPAPTPTPSPVVVASTPALALLITPGASVIQNQWTWPQQGAPGPAMEQTLAGLETPAAIAKFLQKNTEWRDDYDTGEFLKPEDLYTSKRGVCSAFARFWVYALGRQGIKADFVAFWGPSSAHAVATFRAPDGRFRLGSNQFFYDKTDLDPGNQGREAALIGAAKEFYGEQWAVILVFSDAGQILQRIANEKAGTVPLAPPSGRGLFSIRR